MKTPPKIYKFIFVHFPHFSFLLEMKWSSDCLQRRKVNLLISSLTYKDTTILIFFFFPLRFLPLSPQTDLNHKLSLCSKLCFAIGGAPKEVAASATAFFLQIYLLDVAQVMYLRKKRMKKYKNVCLCSSFIWINGNVSSVPACVFNSSLSMFCSADQRLPGVHGAVHR